MSGSSSSSDTSTYDQSTSPDSINGESVAMSAGSGAAAGTAIAPGIGTAVGAVLGAGISIFGQLSSASDQADIQRKKQKFANEQADELLQREAINDVNRMDSELTSELNVGSEVNGHDGNSLGSQLEIKRQTELQIALNDRDAQFQASQLRKGGALEGQLGDSIQTAGYYNAAGTALTGVGRALTPSTGLVGPGNYSSLPAMPRGY